MLNKLVIANPVTGLPGPVEAMTRDNYFFALGQLDQQLRHVAEDLKEMCVRVEGQ